MDEFEDWVASQARAKAEKLGSESQFAGIDPEYLTQTVRHAFAQRTDIKWVFELAQAQGRHNEASQELRRAEAPQQRMMTVALVPLVGVLASLALLRVLGVGPVADMHWLAYTATLVGWVILIPFLLGMMVAAGTSIVYRARISAASAALGVASAALESAEGHYGRPGGTADMLVTAAAREAAESLLAPSLVTSLSPDLKRQYLSDQHDNPELVLPTPMSDELYRLVSELHTGCVAVAGERGVGKTATLVRLRDYLQTGVALDGEPEGSGARGTVIWISAPTKYQERELVLSMLERLSVAVSDAIREHEERAGYQGRAASLRAVSTAYLVLGLLGAIVGGILGEALLHPPVWARVAATAGPLALGVGGFVAFRWLRPAHLPERLSSLRQHAEAARHNVIYDSRIQVGTEIGVGSAWLLAKVTGQVTRTIRPYTLPGAIQAFRKLARDFASQAEFGKLVIIVDEVDKMATEQIGEFLRVIKALFGVPDCFFLVSISADAAVHFEHRGVLGRNELDSSFDRVFHIAHLGLYEAERLVSRRLGGGQWPRPYAALAHVLSAGNARDTIRYTRRMIADKGLHELAAAKPAMIQDEFATPVARGLGRFFADSGTRGVVVTRVRREMNEFLELDSETRRRRIAELHDELQLHGVRSVLPAAVLAYLATTLDLLEDRTLGKVLGTYRPKAGDPPQDHPLDTLAKARRSLWSAPESSLADIHAFRQEAGLPDIPSVVV